MKTEILFFATALMFFTATAHGGSHEGLPEPGATPGSMMFGLERAQESVSLALTFNKKKKAQKKLNFAQKRLSEAKKLAEDNESERAGKAMEMYQEQFRSAQETADQLPEEAKRELGEDLNDTREVSVGMLKDLKERLPEEAMKGINRAIKAQEGERKPTPTEPRGEKPDRAQGEQPGTGQPDNTSAEQEGSEGGAYVATGRVIKSNDSGSSSSQNSVP